MRRVSTVLCLTLAATGLFLHAQEQKPDPQRPPTFRTGAHFVAVDAYPTDTVSIEASTGTLLGRPIAYRAASAAASAYRPLAAFQFRRTERVRIEWPALQAVDSYQARLLDRTGKPIAIPMTTAMRDNGGAQMVATDLNLAPLSSGDYLIEVTAKAGDKTQTEVVAIRVAMTR